MKRVQRVSQRRPGPSKPERKASALDRPARDLRRAGYLGIQQLLEYCPFLPSEGAAREWIRANKIPSFHTGRGGGGKVVVRPQDIDLAIQQSCEKRA